jgi:hypothetical protein
VPAAGASRTGSPAVITPRPRRSCFGRACTAGSE